VKLVGRCTGREGNRYVLEVGRRWINTEGRRHTKIEGMEAIEQRDRRKRYVYERRSQGTRERMQAVICLRLHIKGEPAGSFYRTSGMAERRRNACAAGLNGEGCYEFGYV
jgi:hypothetical protein